MDHYRYTEHVRSPLVWGFFPVNKAAGQEQLLQYCLLLSRRVTLIISISIEHLSNKHKRQNGRGKDHTVHLSRSLGSGDFFRIWKIGDELMEGRTALVRSGEITLGHIDRIPRGRYGPSI